MSYSGLYMCQLNYTVSQKHADVHIYVNDSDFCAHYDCLPNIDLWRGLSACVPFLVYSIEAQCETLGGYIWNSSLVLV